MYTLKIITIYKPWKTEGAYKLVLAVLHFLTPNNLKLAAGL